MAITRMRAVTMDDQGVDPLKDKVMDKLMSIKTYTSHTVSEEERGRPDLISYREYGKDVRHWWIIVAYNKLIHNSDIREGMVLKIPALSEVSTKLVTQSLRKKPRKISI
jgi:hypothetical protein